MEQYRALLAAIPEINAHLKAMGEDVGHGDMDTNTAERVPRSKPSKQEDKANIDATSDEEET